MPAQPLSAINTARGRGKPSVARTLRLAGVKYDFYCVSTNHKGYFKYVGDFSKIENKKIVKFRMESLNGNVDFDVNKKKTDAFSNYFVLIKNEVETYFPQGISPLGELILKLENTIDLQEKIRIIDALFLIKK